MIHVPVQAQVIEGCMKSGFKMGTLFEVMVGLPMDAQLVGSHFEKDKGLLVFHFSQPRVPDEDVTELQMVIKGIPARPLSEEKKDASTK